MCASIAALRLCRTPSGKENASALRGAVMSDGYSVRGWGRSERFVSIAGENFWRIRRPGNIVATPAILRTDSGRNKTEQATRTGGK